MTRFKKVPVYTREGKITYGPDIVSDITYLALKEVPNVELYSIAPYIKYNKNSIKVTIESDGVYIDVTIKTHFTQNISDVAFKVQEAIRHNVEAMTEYHVASVNVIIKGVTFTEENQPQQKAAADNTEEKH